VVLMLLNTKSCASEIAVLMENSMITSKLHALQLARTINISSLPQMERESVLNVNGHAPLAKEETRHKESNVWIV
jgi:hypothetical protein